jgi:tRNA(Ile)-lysidine synthase
MTTSGDKIVIALSGGPDSVFMFHSLFELREELNVELFAVHVNHCIRGGEAKRDEEFARRLCETHKVPIKFFTFDIPAIVKQTGKSLEEAGHDVRRQAYMDCLGHFGANRIATGHTADEQAETVLIRLLTGAGEQGLAGIAPVSEGCFIRPLIETGKADILEYLGSSGLEYMTDHTNFENTTVRNRVRNILLPVIQEHFNPDVESALCRTASIFREQNDYLDRILNFYLDRFSVVDSSEARLDLPGVTNLAPWIMKNLLRRLVARFKGDLANIGYVHTMELFRLAEKPSGSSIILPGGLKASREYNYLIIKQNNIVEKPALPPAELFFPGENHPENWNLKITGTLSDECLKFDKDDRHSIYVDYDLCQDKKFSIRTRRDGDSFIPSGMRGSKKVKDFLIDMKISREQRDLIPMVLCDEDIIWIAGYRRSDLYRILPSTKRVLNIRIEKPEL